VSGDIYDYFQRACFRALESPRGDPGRTIYDRDGNSAVFWIETARLRVASVQYKCTTCVTLLALCEHLCEILVGKHLSEVEQYTPEDLLSLHPEIPLERQNRADLAIDALRSAVKKSFSGEKD
jgi:hypothetical protein